jgi:prepilin-type N-terminal cleavage/methylation domain-containing protein
LAPDVQGKNHFGSSSKGSFSMSFVPNSVIRPVSRTRCRGYTLIEILVATALTLILMTAVVSVFGGVGDGIAKARRAMDQNDRLRTAIQQLRLDLLGVTVKMDGRPARPEEGGGYLEYIEGGTQATNAAIPQAINAASGANDLTVGETGDILMFTTRSAARPFVGRYLLSQNNGILQSDVAEVCWFLRGTTLHRRVLLVAPGVAQNQNFGQQPPSTFFQYNDISARLVNHKLVPNSLVDLTKRENRFAHPTAAFPFDARAWGILGLPTLAECSSPTWMSNWINGTTPPPPSPAPKLPSTMDYWDKQNIATSFGLSSGTLSPDQYLNRAAQDGTRLADDVVLTNVIGFDVKVWEPAPNGPNNNAPGYVDLGYFGGNPIPFASYTFPPGPYQQRFQHPGLYVPNPQNPNQYGLAALGKVPRVYDSGCFGYENEGFIGPNGVAVQGGRSTNGLADSPNPADTVVDNLSEWITCVPYPVPVRGMQIKIRCFDLDSRQIREMTIEHDFLPK